MTSITVLLPAVLVLLVDQLTKMAVTRRFARGSSAAAVRFVRLHCATRPSRSRRLPDKRIALALLWGAVLGAFAFLIGQGHVFHHPAAHVGIGAALGGAASNFYDRLRTGAVVGFVAIGRWPLFNLADVGITLGAVMALWFIR
jgi:signal peptidase II